MSKIKIDEELTNIRFEVIRAMLENDDHLRTRVKALLAWYA